MLGIHEQQSIFLGSPVDDQLREALSTLDGKVAPDLLVKLRDVCQLDLFFESEPHDHFRCVCLGEVELVPDLLKQCQRRFVQRETSPDERWGGGIFGSWHSCASLPSHFCCKYTNYMTNSTIHDIFKLT